MRAAWEWRSASAVNRTIDSFIWSGMFFWGAWQVSGDLAVMEDGVPSTWQAIAIESDLVGVANPGPCRPEGGLSVYAWRPLPDSTGIEAMFLWVTKPFDIDQATFGLWAACPGMIGSSPPVVLNRANYTAGGLVPGLTAVDGQVHVGVINPHSKAPCTSVAGTLWSGLDCIQINVAVTAHAVLQAKDDQSRPVGPRRVITIGPSVIPGQRRPFPCQEPWGCRPPPQQLPAKVGYGPVFSPQYAVVRPGDSLLRNFLHVRFAPEVTESGIVATLTKWNARAGRRGPAGDVRVQVPDPGPGPGSFDRLIARLASTPGVDLVLPIRLGTWTPVAPPGRLEVSVEPVPHDRGPSHVCVGGAYSGPQWVDSPWCRVLGAGTAAFDSLPTSDYAIFAVCYDGAAVAEHADSVGAAVGPRRTTRIRIRATAPCSRTTR